MKRIFVTGATGFIGSHFVKLALSSGFQVTALRRTGSAPAIELDTEPDWIEGDLSQVTSDQLASHDALFHFASQGVSPQPTNWKLAFEINVSQSIALFSTASDTGIPRLVSCGSCFEFGLNGEKFDFIPADAPLAPVGPYAASKAAFSAAITSLARTSPSSISLLRPFHIFGDGQHSSNFWPSLRQAALSGQDFAMTRGEQIRDYLPVEEVVQAFLDQFHRPFTTGRLHAANIGSGRPISLTDFASNWWKKWNATGSLKPGDIPYRSKEVMRFVPDLTPLQIP